MSDADDKKKADKPVEIDPLVGNFVKVMVPALSSIVEQARIEGGFVSLWVDLCRRNPQWDVIPAEEQNRIAGSIRQGQGKMTTFDPEEMSDIARKLEEELNKLAPPDAAPAIVRPH